MKKVGIYIYRARVDIPNIIEAQIQKLQDYAVASDGTVVEKYIDIGRCHSNKCRSALRRLISDCKAGMLDEVLILRARHLSYKAEEFLELYNLITENNVTLDIVEEPISEELVNLLQIIGVLKEKGKLKKEELICAGCKALLNEYGPKKTE